MRRVYRWLLGLYPAGFRDEYAALMEQALRDELAEAPNALAVVTVWLRLLSDLALSLPFQLGKAIWQDSKHTLRLWAKRPWQTGFAILALATAIGANTGVFSVVNALLLRSLPFRDGEKLVFLRTGMLPHDSAAQFDNWRRTSKYLDDAALSEEKDSNLGNTGHTVRIHAAQTSWNFFSLLGVKPQLGREFSSLDTDTAVVSYGLWQELFAGSGQVLGKVISLDGTRVTIVGVMPAGFTYPHKSVLWKAATLTRGNNGWDTIGRLKPDVGWPQARAEFFAEVAARSPKRKRSPMPGWEVGIYPLRDALAGPVKAGSLLLLSAVLLILLIACANLANLMLARTADRNVELSIRSALGASRGRLMQQLMTECLLLAFLSAAFGVLVAVGTTSAIAKAEPSSLPSQTYTILDGKVLAFTLTTSVVSAFLVGLLPALSVGRTHIFAARGSSEFRRSRLVREGFVIAQVVLTVVLLIACVSVERAFSHLMLVDRGFKVDGVLTASVSLDGTRHSVPSARLNYFNAVLGRLRRLPGIRYASATDFLPLYSKAFLGGPVSIDGRHSPPGTGTDLLPVMSDYFASTGGQLLHGREFTDAEVQNDANVAMVNDTLAKTFFGTTDAIGHLETTPDKRNRKIIGVVKSVDFMDRYLVNFGDLDPPETFIPGHAPGAFDSTFVLRTQGRPEDYAASVRQAIQSEDSGVPVFSVKSMRQRVEESFARPRFYRNALVFFSSFGLLLAVLGIYAVVSYAATQRTHEMGVRLAMGTTSGRLRTVLLRQGLVSVIIGAVGGLLGAVLIARLLESLVEGASTLGIASYLFAVPSVCTVAAISIWMATRRIKRLDISEILRAE